MWVASMASEANFTLIDKMQKFQKGEFSEFSKNQGKILLFKKGEILSKIQVPSKSQVNFPHCASSS